MKPWAFQTGRQLSLDVSKRRGTLRFSLELHESPCELLPSPCEEELPFTCELPGFAEARKQIVKMMSAVCAFISLYFVYACVLVNVFVRCVMRMYFYLIHDKKKKVVTKKGKDYNLNNGIWWQSDRVKLYDELMFD